MLRIDESLKAGETNTIHKFEVAGLGKAPFRFTGSVTEKTWQGRAASTCDYCGTCIRWEFWVRSSDGKVFKTGCYCIHKTGDAGLIKQIAIAERKLRDAKNQAARERKAEHIAQRVNAAKAILDAVKGTLASKPHPHPFYADAGKTLLDYVHWCFANRQGERAAFIIEEAAKNS